MEVIYQGWLDMSATKSNSTNWLKKSVTKPWKKRFFFFCRDDDNNDRIRLLAFDKEGQFNKQKPKKVLELFPKYKVAKKQNLKGKEFVFQVSNEEESWFLAAEKQQMLDLWVIQIQMQTKLSRVISGRIFSVKAANTRQLQRIGAKDQNCLLHFTRWGLTLALEESRSVLSLWPLDTIRNYECTGTGQFVFEAGRRSPSGEGKYVFFTHKGEDEVMFNVIDVFVTARLDSKADLTKTQKAVEVTDDDILIAYDKHHSCILGVPPPDVFQVDEAYSKLGRQPSSQPLPTTNERPPSYAHLTRTGEIRPAAIDPDNCTPASYDQLDRTSSWGAASWCSDAGYNTIDRSVAPSDAYDHLGRITVDQGVIGQQDKGHYNRFGSYSDDKACISPGHYPLAHHEPSVPNILEDSNDPFKQRFGSFSSTNSDVVYSNTTSPSDRDFFQARQNSTGGLKQRRTTKEKDQPVVKDDPPPLPARTKSSTDPLSLSRPVPKPSGTSPVEQQLDAYVNKEAGKLEEKIVIEKNNGT